EGLGDLLMAETESQRRRALAAAEGEVSRAVNGWASTLLGLAARAEAQLDFADEDEVAGSKDATLAPDIATLAAQIRMVTDQPPVERLRDGVRVVLAGAPNTGKSTLFNAMAGRDAAIVSPIAGTTRDRIEAPVVRDGLAYLLIDTAGLAETTDDAIEAIGIMRSRDAMAMADIILWLDDAPPPADVAARLLWLYPRADRRNDQAPAQRLAVSAVTGEGMSALWDAVAKGAAGLLPREDRLAVNQRQRHLLIDALAALDAAAVLDDPVLAAEELRIARGALDRITGVTDVEAMLDTLFGRFCIGK
ncbi:MAG: GTPase, partial [Sphingomonas sp.]